MSGVIEKVLSTREIQGGRKELKNEYDALLLCKKPLDEERELRFLELTPAEEKLISSYQFLSRRPCIVISNIAEDQIKKDVSKPIKEYADKRQLRLIEFCGKIESEISELAEEERPASAAR